MAMMNMNSEKINNNVIYPFSDLDLSPWVHLYPRWLR